MKVFITGISSGIGRALARQLVAEGHEVWGIARREQLLRELKRELPADKFFFSVCDVTKQQDVERTAAEMGGQGFLPDIVVLNSAVLLKDVAAKMDFSKIRQGFETNYLGALVWVDKFLPRFLSRGSGKFVAVSSTSAFRPDPTDVSLPGSKAALSMAFRSLRLRYSKAGIRFSTVYFGPVATNIIPEYTTPEGKGKYFFVLSAEAAARKLKKAVFGRREKYFFPFWLTLLFRIGLIFPDTWFAKLSKEIKK